MIIIKHGARYTIAKWTIVSPPNDHLHATVWPSTISFLPWWERWNSNTIKILKIRNTRSFVYLSCWSNFHIYHFISEYIFFNVYLCIFCISYMIDKHNNVFQIYFNFEFWLHTNPNNLVYIAVSSYFQRIPIIPTKRTSTIFQISIA